MSRFLLPPSSHCRLERERERERESHIEPTKQFAPNFLFNPKFRAFHLNPALQLPSTTTEEALKEDRSTKVKVRQQQEEKDDQHIPLEFFSPVKDQDVSPATVARVPKCCVPRVDVPPISVAEGEKKASMIKEMNKQNIRAGSIPPPRAVLSSPDNDTVIGNKNKIKAQRPSALKNHSVVQNRSTQSIPLHITENSLKTKKSKGSLVHNCLNERKGSASKLISQIQPPSTGKPSCKEK